MYGQCEPSEDDDECPSEPRLPMCGICRNDPPTNGVILKCGHIFCYLCIKSASETTGSCALCREEIENEFNFQEHPILGPVQMPTPNEGKYWFYEGYQGWWLYDAETGRELEEAYKRGERTFEKFIAGGPYVIDFHLMLQRRKDEQHARMRRVCRVKLSDIDNIIGMAGLKGQDFREALELMKMADSQPGAPVPAPRQTTSEEGVQLRNIDRHRGGGHHLGR